MNRRDRIRKFAVECACRVPRKVLKIVKNCHSPDLPDAMYVVAAIVGASQMRYLTCPFTQLFGSPES
jgi:hypothetical protein